MFRSFSYPQAARWQPGLMPGLMKVEMSTKPPIGRRTGLVPHWCLIGLRPWESSAVVKIDAILLAEGMSPRASR